MKEILKIRGGSILSGSVDIGGAKNSLVALIPASIITRSIVRLENVKPIDDTYTLIKILNKLNVKTLYDDRNCLYIDARKIKNVSLDCEEMLNMRASYYFMGSLLALYKKASIKGPGGCNFGDRPIDLHLKAFDDLGYTYENKDMLFNFKKSKRRKRTIIFNKKSVGATINAILASVKISGSIVLENCALEPEIDDLISFLNKCGAIIKREKDNIFIKGVSKLNGCNYKVMFDRIEAGTFMIIASAIGSCVRINNVDVECLKSVIDVLKKINVKISYNGHCLTVCKGECYKSIDVIIDSYPGFPTDLQQPLTVLLSLCEGKSSIKETIYPGRLSHVDSLNEMNANIKIIDEKIVVTGKRSFIAKDVSGKDLRGGISLVIAALLANGESKIDGVKYIKRGYSDLVYKLRKIGANISIEEDKKSE